MGIVLAAAFYSLHHLGFQTEFVKLFFVGIMYGAACRWARSVLIIYPFFWGVGALFDVLLQAQAITPIAWPWPRSGLVLVSICLLLHWGRQHWGCDLRQGLIYRPDDNLVRRASCPEPDHRTPYTLGYTAGHKRNKSRIRQEKLIGSAHGGHRCLQGGITLYAPGGTWPPLGLWPLFGQRPLPAPGDAGPDLTPQSVPGAAAVQENLLDAAACSRFQKLNLPPGLIGQPQNRLATWCRVWAVLKPITRPLASLDQ